MDIGFERKSWTEDPAGRAGAKTGTPEWHGLRARLTAARAARGALAEQHVTGDHAGGGSFDCASARALAGYGHSPTAVNPVFWADGKPVGPMDAAIAGQTSSDDRG